MSPIRLDKLLLLARDNVELVSEHGGLEVFAVVRQVRRANERQEYREDLSDEEPKLEPVLLQGH